MTQAQLDLQTQLEQTPSDLTTQPLFNGAPVLFLNLLTKSTRMPQNKLNELNITPLQTIILLQIIHMKHHHRKRSMRFMKDPIFLSLPICPPILPFKPSHSTDRDDHLIPILSHNRYTFIAQLTSLYLHPTDYTFRLLTKIKIT